MKKHLLSIFLIGFLFFLLQKDSAKQNQEIQQSVIQDLLTKTSILIQENDYEGASKNFLSLSKLVRNKSQKEYLKILSIEILEKKTQKSRVLWHQIKEKFSPDIVLYKRDNKIIPLVLNYLPLKKNKIQKYINNVDLLLGKIQYQKNYSIIPQQIAPIYVADLLNDPKLNSFSITTFSKGKTNSLNYSIILFDNHLGDFFQEQILSIGKILLSKENLNKLNPSSVLFFHIMNRLTYYFGNPIIQSKKKSNSINTLDKKLLKFFMPIQEIRANTGSIYCSTIFEENKIMTSEEEESIYLYYLLFLINRLKVTPNSPVNLPYLIQFNKLIQDNGCILNLNDEKMELNLKNARKTISHLHKNILSIEISADPKRFETFKKNLSNNSPQIDKIIKIIEKSILTKDE